MIETRTSETTGQPMAELTPSSIVPASVIPSNIVEIDMYRLWRDTRPWLTALGCPDHRPLIEGDHFAWIDSERTLSIAHSSPGLSRLVWATAGDGFRECRYASFELPNGQIASLDLQRGTDLWVTISNSGEEESKKLAGWIDACRFGELEWLVQGAA